MTIRNSLNSVNDNHLIHHIAKRSMSICLFLRQVAPPYHLTLVQFELLPYCSIEVFLVSFFFASNPKTSLTALIGFHTCFSYCVRFFVTGWYERSRYGLCHPVTSWLALPRLSVLIFTYRCTMLHRPHNKGFII